VEAAAKAGWTGLGFIHADLPEIEQTIGFRGLRQLMDDNGIVHVENGIREDPLSSKRPRIFVWIGNKEGVESVNTFGFGSGIRSLGSGWIADVSAGQGTFVFFLLQSLTFEFGSCSR
jgi:hypothetical protein